MSLAKPQENNVKATLPRSILRAFMSKLKLGKRMEFVVHEDISNGHERNKIPALSYRENDNPPSDYHYVSEYIQCEPICLDLSLPTMISCGCSSDCDEDTCKCSQLYNRTSRYYSRGRLSQDYCLEVPEAIYECNAGCKCNYKGCTNRVIQNGSRAKLILFRTRSRGWGVRTLENLKRGTYVGIYTGELVAGQKSYSRDDDTYLFNLSNQNISYSSHRDPPGEQTNQEQLCDETHDETNKSDEQFVCDAKYYGNVTRFINHSCEANLTGIRSFTGHQDSRFPYIAFFANRHIQAGTELTLNYGDNYWLVKCARDKIYCLCKRGGCRFSKKTFPATLKLFNEQKKAEQRT